KGERVEVALFGGDYQEGVLTAYCFVDEVAHIELNGHILVPLQNIASLHCSSRCDAPEPDWPPRGLTEDEREDETYPLSRRSEPVQGLGALLRDLRPARRPRLGAERLRPPPDLHLRRRAHRSGNVVVLRPSGAGSRSGARASAGRGAGSLLDRRAARGPSG